MNDLCRFDPTQYTTAPQQTEGWIDFRSAPETVFARAADHAAMGDWIPLVQGILQQVSFLDVPWIMELRCRDDLVLAGETALPMWQACVSPPDDDEGYAR